MTTLLNESALLAVFLDDQSSLQKALEAGADPNYLDPHGVPLLHLAVKLNRVDLLECLLSAGADLFSQDQDGRFCNQLAPSAFFSSSVYQTLYAHSLLFHPSTYTSSQQSIQFALHFPDTYLSSGFFDSSTLVQNLIQFADPLDADRTASFLLARQLLERSSSGRFSDSAQSLYQQLDYQILLATPPNSTELILARELLDSAHEALVHTEAVIRKGLDFVRASASATHLYEQEKISAQLRSLTSTLIPNSTDYFIAAELNLEQNRIYSEVSICSKEHLHDALIACTAKALCRSHWLGSSPTPFDPAGSPLTSGNGAEFCALLAEHESFGQPLLFQMMKHRIEEDLLSSQSYHLEQKMRECAHLGLLPECIDANDGRLSLSLYCPASPLPAASTPVYLDQISVSSYAYSNPRTHTLYRPGHDDLGLRLGCLGELPLHAWAQLAPQLADLFTAPTDGLGGIHANDAHFAAAEQTLLSYQTDSPPSRTVGTEPLALNKARL